MTLAMNNNEKLIELYKEWFNIKITKYQKEIYDIYSRMASQLKHDLEENYKISFEIISVKTDCDRKKAFIIMYAPELTGEIYQHLMKAVPKITGLDFQFSDLLDGLFSLNANY